MSKGRKYPYAIAKRVADTLVDNLRPFCRRIEIAGSIRRQCPTCGDLEIVAIPVPVLNLIGEAAEQTELDSLLDRWPIHFAKRGRKYAQFSFEWQPRWWFKVDLFLQPDPATWPVNFLLRTGSEAFSKKMVTSLSYGGYKPDAYEIRDARIWRNGAALELTDEREIFDLWGMDYVEPRDRN